MKIDKLDNGNIIIKNSDDTLEHIIATDVFIAKHPRNVEGILISKTPSNQDESEAIVLYTSKITEVDSGAFAGDREALMLLLSELFNTGGADGMGSGFSGSYNDLADKPTIPDVAPVDSVNNQIGAVILDKSDIGLGNIDNTNDSDKPISTATQNALDSKQNALTLGGSIFCVFAEEVGALGNNSFQWSYGNGDESQNGFGITLPFACKLIALTLTTRQGSAEVLAYRNTSNTGKSVISNNTNRRGVRNFKDSAVNFNAGDCINFQTQTSSGVSEGGKVAAWFLME